jgi:putative hydrolase of HD superfamily
MSRLDAQIRFILEADRLKTISRRSFLTDGSRPENSAEHSWHFALSLMVLEEHGRDLNINLFHAVKLAIVHDIVEIDAGDTYVYDEGGMATQSERERAAAKRIFGLLPPDQEAEFHRLFEEYETQATAEAKFAAVVDRLCPVLLNFATQGKAWSDHGVTASKVKARNLPIMAPAPEIHDFVDKLIDEAVERGYLAP